MSSRVTPCLLALAVTAGACDSAPSASGMPEWTATDHDRAEETARAQQGNGQTGAPNTPTAGNAKGPDPVLEATWMQQCAQCHGTMGRGDGPTGPMVHAADLTQVEWQAARTDDQIAAVIKDGKGKMPAFPNLPDKVVRGLVARIRAVKGR